MMARSPSPRARGALERVDEPPMQVVLEPLPIQGHPEAVASRHRTVRFCQKLGGEGNRIAYRAPQPEMNLPDQCDVHQRRPGDTPRDSSGSGLDPLQFVVSDEVVGPFLRRFNRNRSNSNAVKPHSKVPIYKGVL